MRKKVNYNNDLLRSKNRGRVFEQLVTNDEICRMDLVEACGLTKMTISNIVNEFIEKDIIIETDKSEENKPGRKSTHLRISPRAKKIIGLLIHRDFISATLCDCQLNVICSKTIRFTECNLDFLLENVFLLLDEMMDGNEILGIGVGSIGPVNTDSGMILNPPRFYGIKDVPIVQILKERYNLPVYLDYQFNCAARTEKYFGLGKKYKNFLLIGVSDAIGIAIVVDGSILTKMTGISSEFGSMSIDYNGVENAYGVRGALGKYMNFKTEEGIWKSWEILTTALIGLCNMLIPQAIIIRNRGSWLKDEHLKWMEKELNQKIVARDYYSIDVRRSICSNELEAVDCAANILGRVFSGEIEI